MGPWKRQGGMESQRGVVRRRGAPRSLQRTWHIWKAGCREKEGGTPSSFREGAMDLLAEVANIWPPPVDFPVSFWGAGRQSGLLLRASPVSGNPSATQVYREYKLPAIGAAWKHQRILLLDTEGADTSLCFSKHSTRQNKLESPQGYFLSPCLKPQCPRACHSRTRRRGR